MKHLAVSEHPLRRLMSKHKKGEPVGAYSVCSANRFALESAVVQAAQSDTPVLIEATCNQVDQYGGYTGMTPVNFVRFVREICNRLGYPVERLVLGGDHLGPGVWRAEPAREAMQKASELVRAYVLAGFSKIHLDTSMPCADDHSSPETPLDEERVAARAAELCVVAEEAWKQSGRALAPLYVIGTEVPPPGGGRGELERVSATEAADAERTIEVHRSAFQSAGLEEAWDRVIALVVQPGVEFGDTSVVKYEREAARELSAVIERYDNLVYEAHSTDFQSREALRQMVEDHFVVLKVGPRLTFALREALFSLELVECECLSGRKGVSLSGLVAALETAMLENPRYWEGFYHGDDCARRLARLFGHSDRCRYYWPVPAVEEAIGKLLDNLNRFPPPLSVLRKFLPVQADAVREGTIRNNPEELVRHKIMEVTQDYDFACSGR